MPSHQIDERFAQARHEIEQLTHETLHLYRHVNLLYRIGEAIADSAEPDEICRLVLRECVRILRARSGRIEMADGRTFGPTPLAPGEALRVPIETRNGLLGTLTIHDDRGRFFTAADEKLVRAVARHAGVAIENNRLVQGLIQKNEELQTLDRMKDEFVRNVSHELRTPLASIKGFAATILQDADMPAETLREFVGIIDDESDRLVALVNDILDLSKIMAGRMRYVMQPSRLETLLSEVVRLLRVLAAEKGVELMLEVSDPVELNLDPARIAQVFKNLVGNAIKFTDVGTVRVRQWLADGEARVEVSDTGDGIPAGELGQIFESFYRVEGGSRAREGTGLGLALVRGILEAHGAHLDVSSEEGRGSTFTVRFPLGEQGQASHEPQDPDRR